MRAALRNALRATRRGKSIDAYLRAHDVPKLQLGAAENIRTGWLNTDLHGYGRGDELVYLDARKPFPLPDAAFDFAFSEYGASIWADPHLWIPEAARLLRPGGQLIFLVNGTISILCAPDDEEEPAGEQLLRPYFGLHRLEWTDDGAFNFSLGVGALIRLFRQSGFEVLDCIELQAPTGDTTSFRYVTPEWARRWPSEEIWRVRKVG